ncbi:MAG: flagellar brake protein [Proteobacteria bacterium]|nr:flagellar brake protein [Pseudomonadota bacterium]MBU1386474.1 flagellar brake protein [Pseudomonadota bacterium]MBU1544585.1 flagellar brake protein [Pseudomonadota bacterium]MBU2429496.1 flagellar brake protein [Pseudomonadota bacterium]MBU2481204.1 flagellar brake protein [Pseudomonadota bacterium]
MVKKNQQGIDLSQRLFIELGTPLRIEVRKKTEFLSSKLIGMKVGAYLIANLPGMDSQPVALEKEEPVQVKYISQDDIFSFSSRVLMVLDAPDNLVFLQYPDRVESCNIRMHSRVECFLPIHVRTDDHQDAGVITNISAKGCMCMVDYFRSWENISGKGIELLLSYANSDTLAIPGEIRSVQVIGKQMKLGIRFDEVDSFLQSVLETLVPALRF